MAYCRVEAVVLMISPRENSEFVYRYDDLPEALDWLCKSLAASSLCERCNLDLEVLEELVACSSAVGRGELGLERANPCVRALSAGRSLPSARGDHQAQRQSDIPYPTTKQA